MNVFADYNENYVRTNKFYYELRGHQQKLQNINYREGLLKQKISYFPWLDRLLKEINPYFRMWDNVYHFIVQDEEWMEKPIIELNYEEIQDKLYNTYIEEFNRLSKHFDKQRNLTASRVCGRAMKMVPEIEEKLWVIDSFTKEGLLKKPAMMKEVLYKLFGEDTSTDLKRFSLQDLLKQGIMEHQ